MCIQCESGSAQQFPLLERVRSKCKGKKEQIVARKIIDFTGTLLMQQYAIAKSKGKSETSNTSEIVVSVWEGKTEFLCMSLRLNAWYLRALLI